MGWTKVDHRTGSFGPVSAAPLAARGGARSWLTMLVTLVGNSKPASPRPSLRAVPVSFARSCCPSLGSACRAEFKGGTTGLKLGRRKRTAKGFDKRHDGGSFGWCQFPAAWASTTAPAAAAASRAVSTLGCATVAGASLRGGAIRSRHSLRAVVSPSNAISTAFRVKPLVAGL